MDGVNRYACCSGNPVMYVDPSGKFPFFVGAIAVAAVLLLPLTGCSAQSVPASTTPVPTSTSSAKPTTTTAATTTAPPIQQSTTETKRWTAPEVNIEQEKIDFVEYVYNSALVNESKSGVPAQVVTAQACLESGYGMNIPTDINTGAFSYNIFGVKGQGPAGSVLCGTHEFYDGDWVTINDYFAAYNNYDESIIEHADFLRSNSRYSNLFKISRESFSERDYLNEWCYGLQEDGYATDPNYADNLISVLEYWDYFE